MHMFCLEWTDERVAQLTKLRAEGFSASQIANLLGGCTRNSVIGKIHRLGLAAPIEKKLSSIPRAPRNPKRPRVASEPRTVFRIVKANGNPNAMRLVETATIGFQPRCVEMVPRNLTIYQIEANDCRYIAGDDGLFCGHPKELRRSDGKEIISPYCPHHSAICFQDPKPRRPQPYLVKAAAA